MFKSDMAITNSTIYVVGGLVLIGTIPGIKLISLYFLACMALIWFITALIFTVKENRFKRIIDDIIINKVIGDIKNVKRK